MSLRLEDIELIKRLKYLYCRGLDSSDGPLLASLFTEDASIDYRGGTYRFQMSGRDAIVEALVAAFHPRFVGSHTVHHPVIDVHDDDTADGHWTLVDYACDLAQGNKTTVGQSFYRDRYVKQDGRWLITFAEYDRVYERVWHEPQVNLTAHMLAEKARTANA